MLDTRDTELPPAVAAHLEEMRPTSLPASHVRMALRALRTRRRCCSDACDKTVHDLGPEQPHVFSVERGPAPACDEGDEGDGQTTDEGEAKAPLPGTTDRAPELHLRLLTADLPAPLHEPEPVLSPDGTFALVGISVPEARASAREGIVRIDLATGERRTLIDAEGSEAYAGPISPDGRRAVVVVDRVTSPTEPPLPRLHLMDTASGEHDRLCRT